MLVCRERIDTQQGVPILPALSLDGRKMQEVDGEHFGIEQVEKTVSHKLHFILVSGNIGKKTSS